MKKYNTLLAELEQKHIDELTKAEERSKKIINENNQKIDQLIKEAETEKANEQSIKNIILEQSAKDKTIILK